MSTVIEQRPGITHLVDQPEESAFGGETVVGEKAEPTVQPTGYGRSPVAVGLTVMFAAIVVVWVGATALIMALTDVTVVPALGFGAYCAFWLGGGFGTIFGSAAVFGREH